MSLRLEHVEKSYPEFTIRLHFSVKKGEILTLLGPSGCGKTTSLRLVAGFIQPDRGRIFIEGQPVEAQPPHRRKVGIVFQDYALFPNLSVLENINFGPRVQGWDRREVRRRGADLLRLVHLEGYERRKVNTLSGGEKQRVALARALAPRPRLLLLDEPLSALDAKLRQNLRQEIHRIQRELAVTTVYVTHDQEEALAISDRIAVMRQGRIEQLGTPEEVYNRPRTLFVAGFIGQANLVPAAFIRMETEGRYVLVDTALGRFRAQRRQHGLPPRAGRSLCLFFRPEACRTRGPRGNRIRGRVLRREYLGGLVRLAVQAQGLSLAVTLPLVSKRDALAIRAGQEIEFGVDPESCWLLSDSFDRLRGFGSPD